MPVNADGPVEPPHSRAASALREVGVLTILAIVAVVLLVTDRWVSYADDEITILSVATDLPKVLRVFSGADFHEHPPLYDLLIHFWLGWGGGATPWVRLPAILFFAAGLWLSARAAREIGGAPAYFATVAVGAAWPFGFHHGRLAGWYSFSFLLVAWVTWAYLRSLRGPTFRRWLHLQLPAIALVFTSYYGFAVLGLLALDFARRREIGAGTRARFIGATLLVTLAAFMPLVPALLTRLGHGVGPRASLAGTAANGFFAYFALLASESIAPWWWIASVPAAVLILLVTWRLASVRGEARRLFGGFLALLALMAFLGLLFTKRLLLISPWLVIPLGLTAATPTGGRRRWWPAAAVAGTFAIGWLGVLNREHYASQRFVEPWREIAGEVARSLDGETVAIGDNNAFLFELTQVLRLPEASAGWRFRGLVGRDVHHPAIFGARSWLEAGAPTVRRALVVKGQAEPAELAAIDECRVQLSRRCRLAGSRRLVPDTGYALKARLFPSSHQIPWRVEIDEYLCGG